MGDDIAEDQIRVDNINQIQTAERPGLRPRIKAPEEVSRLLKSRAGEGDMQEAIAEIRMLIEAGLMTSAEASRVIARMEDAR